MKYTKKEYLKYVKYVKKEVKEGTALSFKDWKFLQPIGDKAVGIINKIMIKKRKSKMCPLFCKEKDCFDTFEKRIISGKEFKVWVSHCKALNRISKKIVGN